MAPPEARTIIANRTPKVRMLVLETDTPHPATQQETGSFGQVLHDLLRQAGEQHDPKLGIETLMQYVVEPSGGKIPHLEEISPDIHAILITGSVADAHGDDPWILKLVEFVRQVWKTRPDVRFTGICFGHQILCRALGSTVQPEENGEWELSHTRISLTPIGRALFNLPASESYIHLHQMHVDVVVNPPSASTTPLLDANTPVHVWGSSDHTGVQGVYIPKRMFSTQGHMEFSEMMVKRQLRMRVESGALGEEDTSEAERRAEWVADGRRVAGAVLRFFHGDDDDVVV